ncbi:DNA binding protein [Klebsiella michiganensis]|nr:DNA binding protein [Klebsiella michiganensis]
MAVQIIKDDEGKAQYAVIPYDEYFQMCLQLAELDDETEADLEDIPVEHDIYDNVMLPGDVCDIMDKRKSACRRPGAFCAACRSRRWPISSGLASRRYPS